MFGDLMNKMKDAQRQMEESKRKLDAITVEAESNGGKVIVVCNGNKKITDIKISPDALNDKDELEDSILLAVNKAMEKAEAVFEKEMKNVASGMLPGMPGLF